MPLACSLLTGDGNSNPYIDVDILLPDSGATISIAGQVRQAVDGNPANVAPLQPVSGTVTSPGVPGSGSNYVLIEVNPSTGALSSKTSSSAMPTPDAGFVAVFQQTIPSTASSSPSLQGGWQLINQW